MRQNCRVPVVIGVELIIGLKKIHSCLGKRLVTTDVVGVCTGVNDESNGPVRELPDFGQDAFRHLRRSAVDDHRAVLSDLDADVPTGARYQVEIRPYLKDFNLSVYLLLGGDQRRESRNSGDSRQQPAGLMRRPMLQSHSITN